MRCEEVGHWFAEYLAGSLDASDTRALQEHVAACARCQAEYGGVEALWQALGSVPVPPVPSNRMRERFSVSMAAERASADRRPASRLDRGPAWSLSFRRGEPLAQMALAASLLVVGLLVGRSLPARAPVGAAPAASEISEVRSELRDMRQMLTLSLMQQQSATERLRGVSWTAQIDQPGNEIVTALLDTLLHDQNVNVRLAAVDALRRFSGRADVRGGTKRAVTDRTVPLLQVAVIDFMVDTRDPQAQTLLRTLSEDASVDRLVRERAQWGLEQLAS